MSYEENKDLHDDQERARHDPDFLEGGRPQDPEDPEFDALEEGLAPPQKKRGGALKKFVNLMFLTFIAVAAIGGFAYWKKIGPFASAPKSAPPASSAPTDAKTATAVGLADAEASEPESDVAAGEGVASSVGSVPATASEPAKEDLAEKPPASSQTQPGEASKELSYTAPEKDQGVKKEATASDSVRAVQKSEAESLSPQGAKGGVSAAESDKIIHDHQPAAAKVKAKPKAKAAPVKTQEKSWVDIDAPHVAPEAGAKATKRSNEQSGAFF